MLDIDRLKPAISELCRRLRVTKLDVFGSATTDSFGPDSDFDVLVRFERCVPGLFTRYFDLKEGLQAVFGRPVDVIVEDALKNPYFKLGIGQMRKNIYVA
jgi:predicted nucleotidyltransferase